MRARRSRPVGGSGCAVCRCCARPVGTRGPVAPAVPATYGRGSARCRTEAPPGREDTRMNIGKMLKTGAAIKVAQVVQREMSKPENQRKAKELLTKATRRGR